MDSQQRVLIAGCGDLGTELGLRLADGGQRVWGLRRRAEPLPSPLQTITADLTELESLALPGALDLVYYIATPGAYDDEAYRRAYVLGLRNLLAALQGQRPRRLVFVSSTAVYGQTDGGWVDEGSPTVPGSFSGARMLEAEELALGAGLDSAVVRFGGIYGPGRTRMLRKIRAGEACIATPPQYTNRIHREDCIGILAHLGRSAVAPGIYLGVDDAPCTQCELMDWLAAHMGLPRPPRQSGTPGGLRESNKRCSNAKLKASGYRLRYPSFREGYAAMIAAGD
jgi:nucleoside-diphosphate-sugar epimerase